MSFISALFIEKIAEAAALEGMSRSALLLPCGVDPERPIDVEQMISSSVHYDLWETIMLERDPGFPIRYANTIAVDDYGTLGLAIKTAPDLQAAFERAIRYSIVMTNSSWLDVRMSGEQVTLLFNREGERRLGMRCANEAALAEYVQVAREISGVHVSPERVFVRHEHFGDTSAHEAFFGCDICFAANEDSLIFKTSVMQLPVLKADEGLSNFILGHLDKQVSERGLAPSLVEAVQRIVCDELPGGVPKMETVARRVGMSKRTLQRRLGKHDISFQAFVDNTRQNLANQLLRQTPRPLADIAFLLGFSEQSAFQRAFKRWTGQTPAEYRAVA